MISVRNLTKRFGEVLAVHQVSFEVHPGEVMGFLGPNGAGKTTTLRILTGYLPATAGHVHVDGLDVLKDSLKVRQRIGYLPENVPLYLDMRVKEYLRYRGMLKGVSRKEVQAYVDQAMQQVALTHMANRIVGQLSKGYRQRVGLADALVAKPKLLLLDEPTGGLDPHQRKEVLDLIRELAKEQTILLSSHVLAEVESISSRVMIIQQGQLLACGTPAELTDTLQEAPKIFVEARLSPDELRRLLSPFEDRISGTVTLAEAESGWARAALTPADKTDLRSDLGVMFHEKGVLLRELARQEFSLEELFLRITAQAAQRQSA
jgi:ABC-2 type transport system ATP-binding protein